MAPALKAGKTKDFVMQHLRLPALESDRFQDNVCTSWHFTMNLFLVTALLYGFLYGYTVSPVSFVSCSLEGGLCMLPQNVCASRPDYPEQSNQIKLLQALCCEGSNLSQKRGKSPMKPVPSLTFPLTGGFPPVLRLLAP